MNPLAAAVRADPTDLDLRRVLADAWLSEGDPRGERVLDLLDGNVDRLDRYAEPLRKAGASRVRFDGGLVTTVTFERPPSDLDWMWDEPLIDLELTLPWKEEEVPDALVAWTPMVQRCRGLLLRSRIHDRNLGLVFPWLQTLAPDVLGLDLWDRIEALPDLELPSVRVAELRGGGALLKLITGLPSLEHVRLISPDCAAVVRDLLSRTPPPFLDLRGQTLERKTVARLVQHAAVLHEQVGLQPSEREDVFGLSGEHWPPPEPTQVRCTVTPDGRYRTARSATLQIHEDDGPVEQVQFPSEVTAVEGSWIGLADGRVLQRDEDAVATLPGAVEELVVQDDRIAARCSTGWWTSTGDAVPPGALFAWLPEGFAWSDGSVVHRTNAAPLSFGEPVRALTSDPRDGSLVAIAGHQVWRGTDELESIGSCSHLTPRLSLRRGTVAWTTGDRQASVDGERLVSYGEHYTSSTTPILIADLCAVEAGVTLVVLEHGSANLLLLDRALKLDAFPGETHRRWTFVYNGSILMAE